MTLFTAFTSRSSDGNPFEILIFLIVLVGTFAARYKRFFLQWLEGFQGRDWAVFSATVDVVSVVEQTEERHGHEYVVGYLATLTYFYRNPELQVGEYYRTFSYEAEAQAWANTYKGHTVTIRVNPRDPSRSVLRKEDL